MSKNTPPATPWSGVEVPIDRNVSIGDIPAVPCAAVAVDESTTLAALPRREDEPLVNLLNRLDEAVGKAFSEAIY